METLKKWVGYACAAWYKMCFALPALVMALFSPSLWAANPTYDIGNLRWSYTTAGVITGVLAVDGSRVEGAVTIPSSINGVKITKLANYAFDGKEFIEQVYIPEGIASIGQECFDGCKRLARVELPASVRTIGVYAFRNCAELYEAKLNEGLTEIGSSAFVGCSSLTGIDLPSTLQKLGNSAFEGVPLAEAVLPDSVTSVGASLFSGCKQLKSAVVGSGVAGLPNYMFDGCTELASVTLKEGALYSIGQECFDGCKKLASIEIPASVRTISTYAFRNCSSLDYIYFKGNCPTTVNARAFDGCKSGMIIYRSESATGFGAELNGYEVKVWSGSPAPTPSQYTVYFNANGGVGTMPSQTFTSGVRQDLNRNTFTCSGYEFEGWMTSANGSDVAYADGDSIIVSANMTLYAKWVQTASTGNLRFHSDNSAVSDGVWFREYVLNNENPVTLDQNPRVVSTICRGGFVRIEEMGGWGVEFPPWLCARVDCTGSRAGYYSVRYEVKVEDEILSIGTTFYTNATPYVLGSYCTLWGIYNAPVGDYTATVKFTDPSGAYVTKTKSFRLNDSGESVASALKSSSVYVSENSFRPLTDAMSMGLISLGGDGTWLGTQGGGAISGYVSKGGSSRLSITANSPKPLFPVIREKKRLKPQPRIAQALDFRR